MRKVDMMRRPSEREYHALFQFRAFCVLLVGSGKVFPLKFHVGWPGDRVLGLLTMMSSFMVGRSVSQRIAASTSERYCAIAFFFAALPYKTQRDSATVFFKQQNLPY
jgi:hypothetical protein